MEEKDLEKVKQGRPDINDATMQLSGISQKWHEIATGLNVNPTKIAEESGAAGASQQSNFIKVDQVITEWHASTNPPFQWKNVHKAVKKVNRDPTFLDTIPNTDDKPESTNAVVVALGPVAQHWYIIGVMLKVRSDVLNTLRNDTGSSFVHLNQILQEWQSSMCSPFTWETLIDVIGDPNGLVNDPNTAEELCDFLLEDENYYKYIKQV